MSTNPLDHPVWADSEAPPPGPALNADAAVDVCDFALVSGYLLSPPGGDRQGLEDELAAAQRAGVAGVELLERAPLPAFDTGPCLHFPDQGQFDPRKYVAGLVRAIRKLDGSVYE